MSEAHKPQWTGLTIETANERHILPLYEPEQHSTDPGSSCPCYPEVTAQFRADPQAPPIAIYTHNNLTHAQ